MTARRLPITARCRYVPAMTSARKLAASVFLAGGLIAVTAAPASARGLVDEQNTGGGTVGLDCVYVDDATPHEWCQVPTPERDITPHQFVNPFLRLWSSLEGWL